MQNQTAPEASHQAHVPFLMGRALDIHTLRHAGAVLLSLLMLCILNLMVSAVLDIGQPVIRVSVNLALFAAECVVFSFTGMSSGASAVRTGEIMRVRQESGQQVTSRERAVCFHPAKGFLQGWIGSLPLLVFAVLLALTAKRQMTSAGALPSWTSALMSQQDFAAPLTAYTRTPSFGVEDVSRMVVRSAIMPLVHAVSSGNSAGLLTLERFSPLLVLLPGTSYGVGYLGGVRVRDQVHQDIQEDQRRRDRKERRERKARQRAAAKSSRKELL